MAISKLKAEIRKNLKKSFTKQLRKDGYVPGVYYYHQEEPIAIKIEQKELMAAIRKNSHIFDVDVDGKVYKTMIKEVQWHPVSDEPIHVDFFGVNEKEPVELRIKVETVGTPIGVKEQGGLVSQSMWHIDVRCLITNIPNKITIDISDLAMGDSIAIKDLDMDEIEFVDSPERSIVSVIAPKGLITLEEEEEALEGEEIEGEEGVEGEETEGEEKEE
ncbi:MAG: 50S ribosomal protein L25 [Fidelibacterota bacterium]